MVDSGNNGSVLWDEFLTRNGISTRKAAQALLVAHTAVHSWRNGARPDSEAQRAAIHRYTKGAVKASSWKTTEDVEREQRLKKVKPFHADKNAHSPAAAQLNASSADESGAV